MSWLAFFFGLFLGCTGGVILMCLLAASRDQLDVEGCTQDCNQGRNCKCANEVHP